MNVTLPTTHEAPARLREFANSLAHVATKIGLEDLGRTIVDETGRRLSSDRIRVVVLGEIKHGKSSLINALIGKPVLPIGVTPTTGAVVEVNAGGDEGEPMRFLAGNDEIDPNRFAALARGEHAEIPGQLHVRVSTEVLSRSIDLIDTPGINDINRFQTALSRGELPRADVLILVLDATQVLNRVEMAYLRDAIAAVGGLDDSGATLLVAINRVDLVAEHEVDVLIDHVSRAIGGIVDRKAFVAENVFATDSKTSLREPMNPARGVRELARLRERLNTLAAERDTKLPARARSALLRYAKLLAHNASIQARALQLEGLSLERELADIRQALTGNATDLEETRRLLHEGQQRIVMDSRERIARFKAQLHVTTTAHIKVASMRVLSTHLPGSLHDAFVAFAREEADRLRENLDQLTRRVLHTHGEQARRRLFQATTRLGLRGPTIYVDPPSVAFEASMVAVSLAGTAVMYFGNLVAGMVMAVAGPLATVALREKSLRDARVRAEAALTPAVQRSAEALEGMVTQAIDGHVAAVEEHLGLASTALAEQLLAVLERAKADLEGGDSSDLAARRLAVQGELRTLELHLTDLERELRALRLEPSSA